MPVVDELVALPARPATSQERGFAKIVPNLMGIDRRAAMARTVGFFTDTTLCIGCKACEVACKEWNQLPGHAPQVPATASTTPASSTSRTGATSSSSSGPPPKGGVAWSMMSDVCKHCALASCMEVCPTNAIIRTEFDTVYIQPDVCNGCRDCIAACPYDVIGFNEETAASPRSARSATTACRTT